ncbi:MULTISPECIES: response regulator [Burkholderiaceae]|nr:MULTISPECIES: response regulator [Burkholderiaceae]MBN3846815.1 response regulator transcription factor [Paraburkholderia sp. Ac-20342]NIF51178.1 response regulator transcription factor [Burkholderia sp. Ax-1724]NIF76003.1 response regulator transcription factor [Paraburkholderia sp. Cy-641]
MYSHESATAISSAPDPIVYVIDDDESIRRALSNLFRSVGLSARTFATCRDFLACSPPSVPSCMILDVRLRGENGLEFQAAMNDRGMHMPVVVITAHGDIEMTVRAMKAGATDFLSKPYRDQDLLDAVSHALAKDRDRISAEQALGPLRAAYDSLTPREREVVELVLTGLLNKQIASIIRVSEVTVKKHRRQAMQKLSARSAVDLVCKVRLLGIEPRGSAIGP